MRLCIQIGKWLMISINSAHMPVKVLSPLHTGLIDGYQLMVSDMVPGFSRGKLFTIEMMPTHFHLQGQPWQHHHNIGNLHVERPHSTKYLPTT